MLYRIVWYGMLNVAAMTMTAGGCGKEYWETLKLSDINKSQIDWYPSFVTGLRPGLWYSCQSFLVPTSLWVRVSLLSLLLSTNINNVSTSDLINSIILGPLTCVSGSLCCHCSCHCRMIQGHPLLSQSGSRPGITLLSLSLSLGIITAQSLRVSACSSLSHHHHHSGSSTA